MKKLKHLAEFIGLHILFTGFRLLPLDIASCIGSLMGRSIGPFLSAHKTAKQNLCMIYPDMKREDLHKTLVGMWDNLGRVAAELPHIPNKKLLKRIAIIGTENIPLESPCIFFSGHLGNWELTYPIAFIHKVPVTSIYREANNPLVDDMIKNIRATQSHDLLPKGPKSSFKIIRALKKNESLAMLIDQKMNDGIEVPFLGHPAMTAPALAEFAIRYNLPLIPARIIRKGGARFEVQVFPPLPITLSDDHEKNVLNIMTDVNKIIESWIREYPNQWFWVHKRWPKTAQ